MMQKWPSFVARSLVVFSLTIPALAQTSTIEGLPLAKRLTLAKAGDDEARLSVGNAFEHGKDVERDLFQAAKWYREAALSGNLEAQFRLARILKLGAEKLPRDVTGALKLFEDASKRGHAGSIHALGVAYQLGDGVERELNRAKTYYEDAANRGYPAAFNSLGMMHLKGLGMPQDLVKARALFEKAVALNDAWGLNNLAAMHEQGWGTAQDRAKAIELYERASRLGLETASKNMARLQSLPATP
jgi:uncharacterized protein